MTHTPEDILEKSIMVTVHCITTTVHPTNFSHH